MGKKKKVKAEPGTLGELLLKAAEARAESREAAKAAAPAPPDPVPEPASKPNPEPPNPEDLSDEALFAAALDEIDKGAIYAGKFGNLNDEWRPKSSEVVETVTVEDVRKKQDDLYFERMIGQLQKRFEDGKYYTPEHYGSEESLRRAANHRYEKARRIGPIPVLDLHDVTLKEVFEILEAFVLTRQKEGAKFVRIIHGKGKNSADGPVLRPLVSQWVEASVRCIGCFPEIDVDGDHGVTVVELKRPSPNA